MIESSNLKNAAAKGLFWSAVERFGSQGIQFVFGIIITRVLNPEDYGLLGMILIFDAVGQALVEGGLGSALIWKKNATPTDKSTVFFFNITISLFLYSVFYLLAPIISNFYNKPILVDLIRVMSLNIVVMSLGLIQYIDIQKRIEFKLFAIVNIVGSVIAGSFALLLAIKGFGAWAIVFQILTKNFFTSMFLWIFNKWRPIFVFNWQSLKQLLTYGSNLMAVSLIGNVFQYLYLNIIGKLFSVTLLGYYTRAVQLQEYPTKSIANIFYRIAFPVFSSIQDEKERLQNAFRKTLKTMIFITFPLLIGLSAVSDSLIIVVFTDKWIAASGYFKLLCLIGLLFPLQVIHIEVLKSKGKSNWLLWLEILTKALLMVNIVITWRWGIKAIIIGQMVSVLFSWLMGSFLVWKLILYSLWQEIKDIFPYFFASIIMYFIVILIGKQIDSHVVSLIVMSISGMIIYFVISVLFKIEETKDVINVLESFIHKIKRR